MEKIVVIGAGPAGIATALALQNECIVLERSSDVAGLSCSRTIDGAVFDYGGHSFHTPHREVRNLVFAALDMFEQERNAQCFVAGEFIPYPFQKHFRLLKDDALVRECSDGLQDIEPGEKADDFE